MPNQTYPTRLLIQRRLTEALEEISVAGGYYHDLSGAVFRGRMYYGEETALPFVSILEAPIAPENMRPPESSPFVHGPWDLVIQGFVRDDHANPTDPAHFLLADVKRRLALEKKKLNSLGGPESGILGMGDTVLDISIGTGTVRPPDEVSASAHFWLTVVLDVAENTEEPYGA